MIIGVLGLGQVGQALKKLCEEKYHVLSKDLMFDEFQGKKIDILHICIPYSNNFVDICEKHVNDLKPTLTIIDSTVAPGTTNNIYQKTKANLVHAPILGKHPNLYDYQRIFIKPLGPVNNISYSLAEKHFKKLDIQVARFDSPLETELAKILDTTYYAWNIIFEKWVYAICSQSKANFDQVYTTFNTIYNAGYAKNLPNVRRPILKHTKGLIGGHCVLPNLHILERWLKEENSDLRQAVNFMLREAKKLA